VKSPSERLIVALERIADSLDRIEVHLRPAAEVEREAAMYWASRCQVAARVLVGRLSRLTRTAAERKAVEAMAVMLPRLMVPEREPRCGWLNHAEQVSLCEVDWPLLVNGAALKSIQAMVKRESA
jgi:hypothetical protein